MTERRLTRSFGGIITLLVVFVFVGVISSCAITIGIWPGQVKLLAPVFCTDAQPDPFVVADTYTPAPGESVTDFTLYCMGPRGDSTDHGFLRPFLLISMVNGTAIFAIAFLLNAIRGRRRGGRSTGDRDIETTDDRLGFDDFEIVEAPDGIRTIQRKTNTAPPGSTPGPFVD